MGKDKNCNNCIYSFFDEINEGCCSHEIGCSSNKLKYFKERIKDE